MVLVCERVCTFVSASLYVHCSQPTYTVDCTISCLPRTVIILLTMIFFFNVKNHHVSNFKSEKNLKGTTQNFSVFKKKYLNNTTLRRNPLIDVLLCIYDWTNGKTIFKLMVNIYNLPYSLYGDLVMLQSGNRWRIQPSGSSKQTTNVRYTRVIRTVYTCSWYYEYSDWNTNMVIQIPVPFIVLKYYCDCT